MVYRDKTENVGFIGPYQMHVFSFHWIFIIFGFALAVILKNADHWWNMYIQSSQN